ncbi:MAG: hypothetical protein JNM25_03325 [Planctomycetes bacterium]|nr:hypothetical protein [Planctomycetota bacterium]
MNVGLVLPKVFAADSGAASPEADYVRSLVTTYGLNAAQERSLRLVLLSAREEQMAVYSRFQPSQLPPAIRNEVLLVRSRTEQRIRAVLDEQQRARFDADSRPQEPR